MLDILETRAWFDSRLPGAILRQKLVDIYCLW